MKRSLLIAGGAAGGVGAIVSIAPAYSLVKSHHPLRITTGVTKKISGTFVGPVVDVAFGYVQVQIVLKEGKITAARATRAPSGRSDRFTQYAIPILRLQTLAAQGSNIQGVSGASYTSYGWYTSLQAALAKAGL